MLQYCLWISSEGGNHNSQPSKNYLLTRQDRRHVFQAHSEWHFHHDCHRNYLSCLCFFLKIRNLMKNTLLLQNWCLHVSWYMIIQVGFNTGVCKGLLFYSPRQTVCTVSSTYVFIFCTCLRCFLTDVAGSTSLNIKKNCYINPCDSEQDKAVTGNMNERSIVFFVHSRTLKLYYSQ